MMLLKKAALEKAEERDKRVAAAQGRVVKDIEDEEMMSMNGMGGMYVDDEEEEAVEEVEER
jgi:hypothetical protein